MSEDPKFISLNSALSIHSGVIREFGGIDAILHQGLLESAMAMPSASFAGEFLHDDLASMGAAYLFHICLNHPFADGNKRTALSVAIVFLQVNGLRLDAPDEALEALTLGVAGGRLCKDAVIQFFQSHVKTLLENGS